MYHNEHEVGKAIKEFISSASDTAREDIHYTSKLASNSDYATARRSIKKSVKECGLGKCHMLKRKTSSLYRITRERTAVRR